MNKTILAAMTMFAFALMTFVGGKAAGQTPNAWGYSTGYGNVYGSYGLAQTMQSMYNVARAQARNRADGRAAATSSARPGSAQPDAGTTTPIVVKNYGRYAPDPAIDRSNAFADALGGSPEERALIRKIYGVTRSAFDKEAAARGWENNIAAGLTFFTVAAMASYHDAGEPSEEAVTSYFKLMNATLDEIPEFGRVSNKDKQNFNNMTVGFAGLLLAGQAEARVNNDKAALAINKKLAAMLIEMVLKTDPENVRLENGFIVFK